MVTVVNPQRCVPFFTIQIPIYDGDTFTRVVDRIRRTSGVPSECPPLLTLHMLTPAGRLALTLVVSVPPAPPVNVRVALQKYLKDARSIPVTGDDSGVLGIGSESSFTIRDNQLLLTDATNGCEATPLGTHIRYTVDVEQP